VAQRRFNLRGTLLINYMKAPLQILHLEDSLADAALLEATLQIEQIDCKITVVCGRQEFQAALARPDVGLILSDFSMPRFDGLTALQVAQKYRPEIPFIFFSGTIGEELAVEALREGATDYVLKDRAARLPTAIKRAIEDVEAKKQRKQDEVQLRSQAALLDLAQDAICVTNMEQSILYWNKSAERMYGWTAGEALGKKANELLFQDGTTAPRAALQQLVETGEWQGDLQQVTREKKKLVVESRWTLVRDEHAAPKSILIINTDVTEKKRIECELLRTQRMETIGALAGGIAHDLNNSLAPVLISRGLGGEQSSIQIEPLINDIVKFARDTFPHSIQIQSEVGSGLFSINGNATQLHQVLLNLFVNARDAMPDGGCLRIGAENVVLKDAELKGQSYAPGPYVLLTASDTGPGMSSEVLTRIFEPFFTTKEIGKGTGLGLSTVMGIVKTHGGFVEVSSELGKGSVFEIFLPATKTAESSANQISERGSDRSKILAAAHH
jgi:two-component system cell cycle sensor histidine kinase/response regulator CckA